MAAKPERILRVDLTSETITSEKIPSSWLSKFIGGKGLGAAYLCSELERDVDPLSPNNKLLFMLGPLVRIAPGCSRCSVMTKSPLTGTFLDSYSEGHFPAFLRFSIPEHMGVIVEGKAERPCYLKLGSNSWELKSALQLEGQRVSQVCENFDEHKVATIGPGGENLVKFATIATDSGNHHAGRGGAVQ